MTRKFNRHIVKHEWFALIGKPIKKISGKPFLSGKKIEIAIDLIRNGYGHIAFLLEDNSSVPCRQCVSAIVQETIQISIPEKKP